MTGPRRREQVYAGRKAYDFDSGVVRRRRCCAGDPESRRRRQPQHYDAHYAADTVAVALSARCVRPARWWRGRWVWRRVLPVVLVRLVSIAVARDLETTRRAPSPVARRAVVIRVLAHRDALWASARVPQAAAAIRPAAHGAQGDAQTAASARALPAQGRVMTVRLWRIWRRRCRW